MQPYLNPETGEITLGIPLGGGSKQPDGCGRGIVRGIVSVLALLVVLACIFALSDAKKELETPARPPASKTQR